MDATPHHVRDVDQQDFQRHVLQRSRDLPVVVDFWAEWCGPCRVLSPLLESLADRYQGSFELAKVDVDRNQDLAAQFAVQGIPTVVAFRDGAPVARFTGAVPEQALREWIDGIMPTEIDLMVDQARTARIEGDDTTAEHIFRQVLEQRPSHTEAGTSLASLLIDRGDTEEALIVLGKVDPDGGVERLQAAARLKASSDDDIPELEALVDADADDDTARLNLAKALAARNEYEPALDNLLAIVRVKGETKDEARLAMLDIFGVLGDEHPLTMSYRRRLASALF
jgi:putative thioredoxin